ETFMATRFDLPGAIVKLLLPRASRFLRDGTATFPSVRKESLPLHEPKVLDAQPSMTRAIPRRTVTDLDRIETPPKLPITTVRVVAAAAPPLQSACWPVTTTWVEHPASSVTVSLAVNVPVFA